MPDIYALFYILAYLISSLILLKFNFSFSVFICFPKLLFDGDLLPKSGDGHESAR